MSELQATVPSALRLEGLRKRYGQVLAVDGLDLEVHAGEFLVLLGSSGSGKSTILRLVAGLIDPDEGRIVVADDLAPRGLRESRSAPDVAVHADAA